MFLCGCSLGGPGDRRCACAEAFRRIRLPVQKDQRKRGGQILGGFGLELSMRTQRLSARRMLLLVRVGQDQQLSKGMSMLGVLGNTSFGGKLTKK